MYSKKRSLEREGKLLVLRTIAPYKVDEGATAGSRRGALGGLGLLVLKRNS